MYKKNKRRLVIRVDGKALWEMLKNIRSTPVRGKLLGAVNLLL